MLEGRFMYTKAIQGNMIIMAGCLEILEIIIGLEAVFLA